MTTELKRQYLNRVRLRYQKGSKGEKSLILDEFCKVFGLTRNHAIKLFNEAFGVVTKRPGPKLKYNEELDHHLKHLWESMGRICSKKMVEAIPLWLEFYNEADASTKRLLKSISSSTIDRHLNQYRERSVRGISSTNPSLLKNKIPIKLIDEQIKEPGYVAADTVAHCGNSLAGAFANTLTMTNIFSGWTENRSCWRKESKTVMAAIKSIEEKLPFFVKGFASDNGNEFLNHDLHSYFYDRENRVEHVRRRPYKKNDNCHVEQKNWTHVRQLFHYSRFNHEIQVKLMNEIYENFWNPLWNHFIPTMKLKTKMREGGKIIKTYDAPKTPYQRLLDSGTLECSQYQKLEKLHKSLNPFKLKQELEKHLKCFFRTVEISSQEVFEAS